MTTAKDLTFPVWIVEKANELPMCIWQGKEEALAVFQTRAAIDLFLRDVASYGVAIPTAVNATQLIKIMRDMGFEAIAINPILNTPSRIQRKADVLLDLQPLL